VNLQAIADVNGTTAVTGDPGTYVTMERNWKNDDVTGR
jgi:hypothetical protein